MAWACSNRGVMYGSPVLLCHPPRGELSAEDVYRPGLTSILTCGGNYIGCSAPIVLRDGGSSRSRPGCAGSTALWAVVGLSHARQLLCGASKHVGLATYLIKAAAPIAVVRGNVTQGPLGQAVLIQQFMPFTHFWRSPFSS